MKVRHKNSKEVFDLDCPRYAKFDGMYGYLVQGGVDVFFIVDNDYVCMSDYFEVV